MTSPPPEQTVRPLGFWEASTAISARRFLGASTMVILAEGTGPMTENIVRAAAQKLFERQAILQCRLSEAEPVPDFVQDVRFEDVPVTVQHADDEQDVIAVWEQLLHEELPDRRRLWEARFVPNTAGDRWRVLLKVHHAVADGRSMAGMLEQLLTIAACLCRGDEPPKVYVPVPPPAEQRLATLVDRETWLASMETDASITPWALDHEAPIDTRRSRRDGLARPVPRGGHDCPGRAGCRHIAGDGPPRRAADRYRHGHPHRYATVVRRASAAP